jgi:hypothetical protein
MSRVFDSVELNDMAVMDHERDVSVLQSVQRVSKQHNEVAWDRVETDLTIRRRGCFHFEQGHFFLFVGLGMSPLCHARERTGT